MNRKIHGKKLFHLFHKKQYSMFLAAFFQLIFQESCDVSSPLFSLFRLFPSIRRYLALTSCALCMLFPFRILLVYFRKWVLWCSCSACHAYREKLRSIHIAIKSLSRLELLYIYNHKIYTTIYYCTKQNTKDF